MKQENRDRILEGLGRLLKEVQSVKEEIENIEREEALDDEIKNKLRDEIIENRKLGKTKTYDEIIEYRKRTRELSEKARDMIDEMVIKVTVDILHSIENILRTAFFKVIPIECELWYGLDIIGNYKGKLGETIDRLKEAKECIEMGLRDLVSTRWAEVKEIALGEIQEEWSEVMEFLNEFKEELFIEESVDVWNELYNIYLRMVSEKWGAILIEDEPQLITTLLDALLKSIVINT
jgi:tetratricopeptide (TPR) repeat protein